ncbi:MAG: penicillin-binding protein 2, partial [Mixta sp.]
MKIRDFAAEEKLFTWRASIAFVLVVVCFTLLVINLWHLQVEQHSYYQTRSDRNDIKMIPIAPRRGIIYDRNGIALVKNITWYDVTVMPYKVKNMQAMLQALTPVIALTPEEIADFRQALKQSSRYRPVVLKSELSEEQVARFAVNQYRFEGVEIDSYQDRQYPYGTALAHVVGYVSK